MKIAHILVAATLLQAATAHAVAPTVPAKGDSRIRFVDYDAANVVQIVAQYGRQTFVKFAEDEKIEDLGGGDTKAWDIGVTQRPNSFFIKPKALSPNTNITVVTNKRHYNFDLQLEKKKVPNVYMVWFRYPDDDAKATASIDRTKHVNQQLEQGAATLAQNRAYTVQGASSISPMEAYDDGSFTYLRFAPRANMPAVYYVDEDGTEKLVNFNVKDDVLVVHRVAPKLVLRRGDTLVACIFNEAFDQVGVKRATNTKSPAVERVIKGAE